MLKNRLVETFRRILIEFRIDIFQQTFPVDKRFFALFAGCKHSGTIHGIRGRRFESGQRNFFIWSYQGLYYTSFEKLKWKTPVGTWRKYHKVRNVVEKSLLLIVENSHKMAICMALFSKHYFPIKNSKEISFTNKDIVVIFIYIFIRFVTNFNAILFAICSWYYYRNSHTIHILWRAIYL